jgi:hypothetical protein
MYRLRLDGERPDGYPSARRPDAYSEELLAPTFEGRRRAFLEHWARNPAPDNLKAPFYELVRLAAGAPMHTGIMRAGLDFVEARLDCSDFVLHAYVRLLYQFDGHPRVSGGLLERIEQTALGFKYWPDEPGVDSMCTWTENHQILFNAAAYLLGQRYPDRVFLNSGLTGREKMAATRPRILRWLDLRYHTGFSEWLSHVYYDEDLVALLNLVDFCADEELATKAAMVIDLILLDMACNSLKGVFGSSHGRSYENTKKHAAQEGTTDTAKLLFGCGIFSGFDNMSAPCFALSERYRMPRVLYEIASDPREEMVHRQRMGIRLDDAVRWGLGFDDHEDGMVWLSLEAYAHPRTINLVLEMFDAFNWWENDFLAPFKAQRRLINGMRRVGLLPTLARLVIKDATRNTREEVNIVTHRTPDTMLSSAVDYRPGYGGDQQHIWQATLGPEAVVFTTHPARREGPSPNYWTGSGTLPRVAQVKNVAIIVYEINTRPGLYITNKLLFTHAWFPRSAFDEVVERGRWICGRRGDGYVALASQHPMRPGAEDSDNELIVEGRRNIWVCETGRRAVDGSFVDFVARIAAARLEFDGQSVVYHSPSQGRLVFGWRGPFTQDGAVVPLAGFWRYDNPYSATPFADDRITVEARGESLTLEWTATNRVASAYI